MISVIMSTYKEDEKLLRESIESILNQTYKDFEYIIILDYPDNDVHKSVIEEYALKDDRIHFYINEKNMGLTDSLNRGLSLCHGEYIARMDADDISIPNRIEKQMAFLQANPDIDVVGGAIEEIDENSNSRGKTIVYPKGPKECYEFFSRRNPHAHPAVLFRKSFFEKAGCKYRPEYRQNQDTMLWLDGMSKGTKHANLQDVVLRFRFTNSLFKKRRNGWAFAKKQLHDRKIINKTLGYGFGATVFGYMMFCMLVSPPWVKKIAYKVFR